MKRLSLFFISLIIPLAGITQLKAQEELDVTATYIKNADFTNGKSNWNATQTSTSDVWSNPSQNPSVIEAYAGWGSLNMTAYELSQNITLPSGSYRLEAYAFYRHGETTDLVSYAKLFAGSTTTDVMNLRSIALTGNYSKYANSVSEASSAFRQGLYVNKLDFEVDNDNTSLNIGISGTHSMARSWLIVGPFKLFRYVTAKDKYDMTKENLTKMLQDIPEGQNMINSINKEISASDEAVSSGGDEIYNAETAKLEGLIKNVSDFTAVYGEVIELRTACETLYQNTSTSGNENKYRMELNNKMELAAECLASARSAEELTVAKETLTNARLRFVKYATPDEGKSLDYSFLTENITDQISGWSKTYTCQNHTHKNSTEKNNGEYTVSQTEGFIENWNPSNFAAGDLYYTINDLPVGIYSISAYTFDNVKSGKVKFFAGDGENRISKTIDATTSLFSLSQLDNIEVGSNGQLKLGLSVEGGATNWIGISQVKLYRTGCLDPYPTWLEMQEAGRQIDQSTLPPAVAAWLDKALNADVDMEDEHALTNALNELTEAVTVSREVIAPYAELKDVVTYMTEIKTHSTPDDATGEQFAQTVTEATNALETVSSLEEINNWLTKLEDSRREYIYHATPESGYGFDMTYKINNPTFDNANINGWTITGYQGEGGFPKYGAGSAEFWHSGCLMSQTITGLPNGEFTVSVQVTADNNLGIQIHANDNSSSAYQYPCFGNLNATGNALAADRDNYRSFVTTNVTDGTLTIGLSNSDMNNWMVFDDFRLTFNGEQSESYYKELTGKIAEAKELRDQNKQLPNSYADMIDQTIADAEALEETAAASELLQALNELDWIMKETASVIEPYKAYLQIKEVCDEWLAKTEEDENHNLFKAAVEEAEDKVNNATDLETINAQTERLTAARLTFFAAKPSVNDGEALDVTFCIQNAKCSNKEGWSSDRTEGNFQIQTNSNVTGEYNGTFLEKWNNSAVFTKGEMPVKQNLINLPEGVYELKAAAFCRNEKDADDYASTYSTALILNDGYRVVTDNVLNYYSVIATVDAGETATIGLKSMIDNDANWNGIADVSLKYLGTKASAYQSMRDDVCNQLTSNADDMTLSQATLDNLKNLAELLSEKTDAEEITDACQTAREALVNAQEAVTPYSAANSAIEETENLIVNSKGGAKEELIVALNNQQLIMDGVNSRDNLTGIAATLLTARQSYMSSNGAKPINGNYFDLSFMIQNRDFSNGTENWNTDQPIKNGENFRTLTDESVNGAYSGNFCERYFNSDASLSEAFSTRAIYQILSNMPEGMYNIKGAAFGQRVWIGEGYNDKNISLYLNDREEEIKQSKLNYTYVQEVLHKGGDLEFGIRIEDGCKLNWIGLGDVQLFYFGNIAKYFSEDTKFETEHELLADVTLNTTATSESWRTLCLPFDADAETIGNQMEIRRLSNVTADNQQCVITLSNPVSNIKAGEIYIVKVNNQKKEIQFNNVTIPANVQPKSCMLEDNGIKLIFNGHFMPDNIDSNSYTLYKEEDAFTLSESNLAQSFQASLKIEGTSANYDKVMLNVDGIITAIDDSLIENEKVNVYSINGVLLKKSVERKNALNGLSKGIYIVNGQKVNN